MTSARRPARAALRGALLLALLAAAAVPASAQGDPGRAFRGLFEAAPIEQTALAFQASIYEGYDSDTGVAGAESLTGGAFSGLTPALVLTHVRQRTAIALSASNVLRYYNQDGRILTLDRAAAFGVRRAWGRTALDLAQTVNHRPYYELIDLPSLATPGIGGMSESLVDLAATKYALTSYGTSVAASRHTSAHQWLTAGYRFRYSHPSAGADEAEAGEALRDVVGHEARVALVRQLSRQMGVHVSYIVRTAGDARGALPSSTHEFNLGVDRLQSVSLTRNTTLAMTTGTGMLDTATGRQYTLLGSAMLHHRLNRSSRVGLAVRRGIQYLDGFDAPVLTDGATVELDAGFGRRVLVQVRGGATRGSIKALTASIPYDTAFGSARLRIALTRRIAGYAEYFDYYRHVSGDAGRPLTGGSWNRHGVRVGVLFDVPLYSDRGVQ
jgi:hypothetical protein